MPLTTTFAEDQRVTYNHRHIFLWPEDTGSGPGVRVQFLGVNSLYITDGDTNLMIDPFFSRPEVRTTTMLRSYEYTERDRSRFIRPDASMITNVLNQTGIQRVGVDAFLMTHAHWDHAMDIAEVWKYFKRSENGGDCYIFGDRSIINIARGGYQQWQRRNDTQDLPNIVYSCREISEDYSVALGQFTITFLRGSHINLPLWVDYNVGGEIEEPVLPPVPYHRYKRGSIFSILIEHTSHGSILNQGSAGYTDDYYSSIFGPGNRYSYPDVVMPGIAGFNSGWIYGGRRDNYFRAVIAPTSPKRILFTHWDEFHGENTTLDRPLEWKHDAYESYNLMNDLIREYYENSWEMVDPQPSQAAADRAERGIGIQSGQRWEFMRAPTPTVHYLPIGPEIKVLPARHNYCLFRRRFSD